MALSEAAKQVAAEFELTDDDVRKTVAEFVAEMGAYR
jgi:hexokinase